MNAKKKMQKLFLKKKKKDDHEGGLINFKNIRCLMWEIIMVIF